MKHAAKSAGIQRRVYLHMLQHRFATHLQEQRQGVIPFNNGVNLINDRYNAGVIMIEPFKWNKDKDHFMIQSVFGHVQELLGHENIKTTQRYTHIVSDALKTVASPLDQVLLNMKNNIRNKSSP